MHSVYEPGGRGVPPYLIRSIQLSTGTTRYGRRNTSAILLQVHTHSYLHTFQAPIRSMSEKSCSSFPPIRFFAIDLLSPFSGLLLRSTAMVNTVRMNAHNHIAILFTLYTNMLINTIATYICTYIHHQNSMMQLKGLPSQYKTKILLAYIHALHLTGR